MSTFLSQMFGHISLVLVITVMKDFHLYLAPLRAIITIIYVCGIPFYGCVSHTYLNFT